jgi:hypothetical protein
LFKIIHEICYYGNGGYDHDTIYDMPLWLRKLTYNFISEQKRKESEASNKTTNNKNEKKIDFSNPTSSKKILSETSPSTYKTKASKS